MSIEMKIHREVELQLDQMYADAERFGKAASKVLGRERGKNQLRNLENIANSTLKTSDVFDYIKRQTARMKEWQEDHFGESLLAYFQTDIKQRRNNVVNNLPKDFQPKTHRVELKEQDIYLQIIRGFIKQMLIHFEWLLSGKR